MAISPVQVIADAMLDKKAKGVISLDLTTVGSAIADSFVICNADSTTAVAAIADNVIVKMQERLDRKVVRMQGLENDFWIILDFGDVVVHIFLTEYREFYRLEDLWADAPRQEYEFASGEGERVKSASARIKPKAVAKVRASVRKPGKTQDDV